MSKDRRWDVPGGTGACGVARGGRKGTMETSEAERGNMMVLNDIGRWGMSADSSMPCKELHASQKSA